MSLLSVLGLTGFTSRPFELLFRKNAAEFIFKFYRHLKLCKAVLKNRFLPGSVANAVLKIIYVESKNIYIENVDDVACS